MAGEEFYKSNLGLLDILGLSGFNPRCRAKLVRHQDRRYPASELLENGWFELYQCYQARPVFEGLDYIVSFYGLDGRRAAFYGIYAVRDVRPARKGPVLSSCPWSRQWHRTSRYYYDLERDDRFTPLRDRLVIDWGASARAWVQKLTNKPVLSISEPGKCLPPFDDYLEFSLSYSELCALFAAEEAHRDWRARLEAVGGIYLILAQKTGDLYVGSAYGAGGIWGRWRTYAKSGHGNNVLLKHLLRKDRRYPGKFRFSILQILPKTIARDEILRREAIYKKKLGTRAIGLNRN
jgi:hypothetical protein